MPAAFLTTYSEEEFEAKIIGLVNRALKQNTDERIAYKEKQALRKILTIPEAAKLTHLSKSRLYVLASNGAVSSIKRGSRILFYEDELIAWLESGRRLTPAQINDAADQSLNKKSA